MASLAALIFRRNPFSTRDDVVVPLEPGACPGDWLVQNYPQGCGGRVWHYHNFELIDAPAYDDDGLMVHAGSPDYLTRPVQADDIVHFIVYPGEPVSITTIIVTAVVTAVVSAGVSLALSLLFPEPSAPAAAVNDRNHTTSPVYNVRSRQNTARLGEPVPVVYGRVLMTPDLIAQPYSIYDSPRDMHVDLLLCLGQGDFIVHDVFVGETPAGRIEGQGLQFIVVPPSRHGGQFGQLPIIAAENGWGLWWENVFTSLEVGEQRFTNALESSGFYMVGRAGEVVGNQLIVLIEWPRGLYQMPDWGDPINTIVSFDIYVDEADADGNPIPGTRQEFNWNQTGGTMDPRRETYIMNLGRGAAWLVKLLRRTDRIVNGDEQNEFFWRGLSLACGHNQLAAYGNTTLLMVRLNASQVSSTAERQVRVDLTRQIPIAAGPQGPTNSPADAFYDILTNQTYGARRPASEVDTNRLNELRYYWAGYGFNAVYTQKTTVWEALSQAVQGVAAAPLPIGGLMSVAQDGIRPARSMMFTEQNMVKGSFQLAYQFEQTGAADGVEIEFVNPDTWSPAYVRYPPASVMPDRLNLFGCSDARHAAQFARLQWQRRQLLRRLVNFDTELEGLIPHPGERIAVAHTLPRWGVSGLVANASSVAGTIIVTLDRDLPWADVAAPWYMMFRDEYSGASGIVGATPGSAANQAVLAGNPWGAGQDWRTGNTQERTHFSWGDGARVVKDFTLVSLAPKGGPQVAVSGVIYDPRVYALTLDFLASPVP